MFSSSHGVRRGWPRVLVFAGVLLLRNAHSVAAQSAVIDIGTSTGLPGDKIDVTVSLVNSGGAMVAATVNDITFNKQALRLDPIDCRINPTIAKSLSASVFRETNSTRTLRVFVQSVVGAAAIPDGPLYTCSFHISASALPGTYALTIRNAQGFEPTGAPLSRVSGMGGSVVVTIVFVPSATPTQPPTPTGTPTQALCPPELIVTPAFGPPGSQFTISGRCYFIHSGRRATVYFDDVQVASVIGDTIGNYSGVVEIPSDAALGTHQIRVVSLREIAAAPFEVAPAPCAGDCNGDGTVTVDDLLQVISIAFGDAALDSCRSVDVDGDGMVRVDELLTAVQRALTGCSMPAG